MAVVVDLEYRTRNIEPPAAVSRTAPKGLRETTWRNSSGQTTNDGEKAPPENWTNPRCETAPASHPPALPHRTALNQAKRRASDGSPFQFHTSVRANIPPRNPRPSKENISTDENTRRGDRVHNGRTRNIIPEKGGDHPPPQGHHRRHRPTGPDRIDGSRARGHCPNRLPKPW